MRGARRKITIERTFNAPIEDVWELWTTKEGIESWWGPEGFTTEVHKIDVRPGGKLDYSMIAVAAEQIEFLSKAGMPTATPSLVTYTEVIPNRRLAYLSLADFIPGVEPYEVMTTVELLPTGGGTRMVMTFDAMHDERWTNLAVMGWESELGKLERVLEQSRSQKL
jgi:uncharacterized protein YndB with AHSA1/START domain